mgnify:CR=1 FL=1
MREKPCGTFQFAVLRAIENFAPEYISTTTISSFVWRVMPMVDKSQFYVSLNRLEQRGLVSVRAREKRPVRGGRSGHLYGLTDAGRNMVREMRQRLSILSQVPSET